MNPQDPKTSEPEPLDTPERKKQREDEQRKIWEQQERERECTGDEIRADRESVSRLPADEVPAKRAFPIRRSVACGPL